MAKTATAEAPALDLGILAQTSDTILGKLETRMKEQSEDILASYLNKQEQARQEVLATKDPVERAKKLNLYNVKFGRVREEMQADKTDISDLTLAFREMDIQLGNAVEEMFKLSPDQESRKARAKARVDAAELEIKIAPTRGTLFGMRDPVASAKKELETAKTSEIEVNAQIAREIKARVQEAKLEENLAVLQARGERQYAALVEGHRVLVTRTGAIKKDKQMSFDIAAKTRKMIQELDKSITDVQAQYDQAKEALEHATEDNSNFLDLKRAESDLKSKLEEMNSDRTALLGVSREETIYATQYEGMEIAAIKMAGEAKATAAMQQSKNRNIAKTREHYVVAMEQLTKIEQSVESLKAGNEIDRRIFDRMIVASQATTEARQGIMAEQPKRLEEFRAKRAEQDEANLRAAGIDDKFRKDFAERFLAHGSGAPTPAA